MRSVLLRWQGVLHVLRIGFNHTADYICQTAGLRPDGAVALTAFSSNGLAC
jgi:hypothetical protein